MFRQKIGAPLPNQAIPAQEPLAFNADAALCDKVSEIVDRDMVDIGRVIPARGQLLGDGHHPAEHQRNARAPLREIGEGDKGPRTNAQQLLHHQIGPHSRLQCL